MLDYVEIPLTMGVKAIVDAEDADRVMQFKWYAKKQRPGFYAARCVKHEGINKTYFLHHFILGTKLMVDHINGDKLDNRKSNLRTCTNSENIRNSVQRRPTRTGYKGVVYMKATRKYEARIWLVKSTYKYLGQYEDRHVAAHEYNKAAIAHFGEFARLNPIGVDPRS